MISVHQHHSTGDQLRLCAVRTRIPVVTTQNIPGKACPAEGWLVIGKGRDPQAAVLDAAVRARAGHATAVVAVQLLPVGEIWQAIGTAVIA